MPWIDTVNWVVENKQFAYVHPITGERLETPDWIFKRTECDEVEHQEENKPPEGVLLDTLSASIMQQIHSNLSDTNRKKFEELPLLTAHTVAMRLSHVSKRIA